MSITFNTNQAPSRSVGSDSSIGTQTTIQKQTFGNSFADKLTQAGGNVAAFLGNGVGTVSRAIGFNAGAMAGQSFANLGQQLSQFGSGGPGAISTQVHTLSGAQASATGTPQTSNVASAGGSGNPFGAGAAGMGQMKSGQAAFGAGAIGLDGGLASSGGMSAGAQASVGGATGSQMGGSIGAAAGGDSQGALLNATKQMQETQMSFNLQYLQLQSQMQNENRSYTAVSNIMKTKHDTVKNSISNVR